MITKIGSAGRNSSALPSARRGFEVKLGRSGDVTISGGAKKFDGNKIEKRDT